jgi:hypothetical protein
VSTKLEQIATALSRSFMPAEIAQRTAAEGAAQTLVLALRAEKLPGFQRVNTGPAKEALALGVLLSVQADEALRKAHREFARLIPRTPLAADGWGCTSPDCGSIGAQDREGAILSFPCSGDERHAA